MGADGISKQPAVGFIFAVICRQRKIKTSNRRLNVSLESVGAELDIWFLCFGKRNGSAIVVAVVVFVIIQVIPNNANFFRQGLLY
jgi:hypothetical protein